MRDNTTTFSMDDSLFRARFPQRCRMNVEGDLVHLVGIETPKGSRVIARSYDAIVVRVPGHKVWVGLSMPQRYQPAEDVTYVRAVPGMGFGEGDDPDQVVADGGYDVIELVRAPVRP